MTRGEGPLRPAVLDDAALVDALGADLSSARYNTDGVENLLGADANGALSRGLWWPALRATDVSQDVRLAVLVRLFLLGADESRDRVQQALPTAGVDALVANGVVTLTADGGVRAALDIRPHSDGMTDFLVVSDQDSSMRPGPLQQNHVLGIGGTSITLAHAIVRTPVARALDLGTGSGIQALHLDAHCEEVVATDVNDRALAVAAATAALNGMSWDLRRGSLFEPVTGERFDLIVSNPPFVVSGGASDYLYRDSGMTGDAMSENLIRQAGHYLQPGGTAQFLANWIVRDDDWRDRVQGWLADTGLHAWAVQREFADPVNYVSLFLSDAGERPEEAAGRGGQWLEWFRDEGITGVGMGVVTLRAPRAGEHRAPEHVLEEITGADEALSGLEVDAFFARLEYLHHTSDEQLLAARLSTAPVILEEHSLPGPDGWQSVGAAVRRPGGPAAVIGVDEVSRALLAGCRGEVPLGMLIGLLASVHGVDGDALASAALPVVREAIGRGILYESQP